MNQDQIKQDFNQRIQSNIQNYMKRMDQVSQTQRPTGQQIIGTSGYYFQALEDLILARQLGVMNETDYNQNLDILNNLIAKTAKYFKLS